MDQINGISQPGDGRGRALGFPTANIVLDDPTHRPTDGIYACYVNFGQPNKQYLGVMHVGPRPTFDASATIEVYILDFPDRDLYGERFTITHPKKLREVEKFTIVEELVTAIKKDCDQARQLLHLATE